MSKVLNYRTPKGPTIIKRAWKIVKEQFTEPWFADEDIYYGTRGEAKSKSWPDYDSMELVSGKEVNFVNIKLRRDKDYDIILHDGLEIRRCDTKNHDRKKIIENLPEGTTYYVQDARSYVGNSILWWAKNGNCYTTDITKAHKYTKDEIQNFANGRTTDIIWESEHVDNNIKSHVDIQYLDSKFKI